MEPGLHSELTRKIIGAVRRVHRVLGCGFPEKVYENALAIELRASGLEVAVQMPIEVRYRGEVVGVYQADLLVGGLVILELKAVDQLADIHEVQLVNYLRATKIEDRGRPSNKLRPKLELKRRIFSNDRKSSP